MNASRAKKIRKQIYGDKSRRITQYSIIEYVKEFMRTGEDGRPYKVQKVTGQLLICRGLRAEYKRAKKLWKERHEVVIGVSKITGRPRLAISKWLRNKLTSGRSFFKVNPVIRPALSGAK